MKTIANHQADYVIYYNDSHCLHLLSVIIESKSIILESEFIWKCPEPIICFDVLNESHFYFCLSTLDSNLYINVYKKTS